MAQRSMADFKPPPDSIWRCPCGYEGRWATVVAHRKGYRKRPACAAGKMRPLDPSLVWSEIAEKDAAAADEDDPSLAPTTAAAAASLSTPTPPPPALAPQAEIDTGPPTTPGDWRTINDAASYLNMSRRGVRNLADRGDVKCEHRGWRLYVDVTGQTPRLAREPDDEPDEPEEPDEEPADPEELARILNERRGYEVLDATPIDRETMMGDLGNLPPLPPGIGSGVPPGDWMLEPPPNLEMPSQARETVSLPVYVRVMYDHMRGQGWSVGDGSLAAFITDIVLDHFENCWDKRIVVIDRAELETEVNDAGGDVESGLQTADAARAAPKVDKRERAPRK